MSSPMDRIRPFIAEFVGTALFLFLGSTGASQGEGILAISTSFGIGLAIAIYVAAPISGGHLNPAVTISMMASKNLPVVDGFGYIVSQVVGAIAGSAIGYGVLGEEFGGSLAMQGNFGAGQGLVAEIVGTFILVTIVFNTAVQTTVGLQTPSKLNLRAMAPFIIGMSVWTLHISMVPINGCGVNPARAMGTAVVNNVWGDHWLYWVGPIIGAFCAVIMQFVFFGRAVGEDVTEEDEVNQNAKVTDARVVV